MSTFSLYAIDLSRACKALKPCVGSGRQHPVLSYVRMVPSEGFLSVQSTNMELFNTVEIDATCQTGDPFLVPASGLFALSKSIKKGNITFTLEDKVMTAEAGGIRSTLNLQDAEEFPEFPEMPDTTATFIPDLHGMLSHAALASSTDATKPTLSGIALEGRDGLVYAVGTDGFRLAFSSCPGELYARLVLPSGILKTIPKGEACLVRYEDNTVWFSHIYGYAVAKLVQGLYPSWWKVVPESYSYQLTVDRGQFAQALESVKVKADKYNKNVELIVSNGTMTVRFTHPDTGTAEASIPVESGDITFAFNIHYLLDVAKASKADSLNMFYSSDVSQVNFTDGTGASYILMPVKFVTHYRD